jgi:probable F420-dependent oxidoreductase
VTTSVRLGVGVPQAFLHSTIDPAGIKTFLQRAEALGFDGLWTQENPLGSMPTLDSLHLLTFAAAHTSRVRLGCAVHLTAVRSPVHLAKSLGTVDHLSGGRLIVGVGLGTPRIDAAVGIDSATRVARFTEGIRLMKALWTEPMVTYRGEIFQLEQGTMGPKPVQKPHPPVWLGGSHPDALRRAAAIGDGWMGAGGSSTEAFARSVPLVRAALEESGRDPDSFPISKRVFLSVDRRPEVARDEVRRWFGEVYHNPDLTTEAGVHGTSDQVRAQLEELVALGANHLLLNPVTRYAEQVEALAEVVGLA